MATLEPLGPFTVDALKLVFEKSGKPPGLVVVGDVFRMRIEALCAAANLRPERDHRPEESKRQRARMLARQRSKGGPHGHGVR